SRNIANQVSRLIPRRTVILPIRCSPLPAMSRAGSREWKPERSPMSDPRLPLEGLVVLDLSRVLAGPYATQMLGDLGAEVWKVERPGAGDETRGWGPPFVGDQSAYFLSINRNKRSAALDFDRAADLALVKRAALAADIVVENFLPGTLDH